MIINSPEEADLAIANLPDDEILNTPLEDLEDYIQSKQRMSESSSNGDPEDTEQAEQPEDTADDKTADNAPQFGTVKVDGEDIPLNSIDDVMQLAQLGTKYSSLSEKTKPIRKIAKTLEKNGLLSEEKINFIVDLMKGNAKAIGKLIRDSKLDPLSDFPDNSEYISGNYMVSDQEMDVQDVLDDIKAQSSNYEETVNTITKMDDVSKRKFYENPNLIVVLSNQIKNGDYQKIVKETKRLKTLGYIPKADDFTNYFNVGKMLFEAGKLADSTKKSKDNAKAQAKKTAASNPRGKSTSETTVDMSKYYDMSDEEILKLDLNKIMR